MNPARVTLYGFCFGHHGSYSSFYRLLSYSRDFEKIDVTPPLRRWLSPKWGERFEKRWYRWSERRLKPVFARAERQCIHYLYPENSLFRGAKWQGEHGLVLSCHLPGDMVREMISHDYHNGFRCALKRADRVVLLSSHFNKDYLDICRPDSIRVIPHGVDVRFFKPSSQLSARPLVLTVGNWLRDYAFWAETVLKLAHEMPTLEFTVVAMPQVVTEARNRVEKVLADRVHFLNGLTEEELIALYSKATLLFLPLKDAGANNAVLESMAAGLPMVVTDLEATREYAGDCASYFSPGNLEECLSKITGLLTDSGWRASLAGAARQRAVERYAWEVIAGRYAELYSQVLEKSPH